MHEYKGRPYTTVERAVQRLVVIVPADLKEQRVDIFSVWPDCFLHGLNISVY